MSQSLLGCQRQQLLTSSTTKKGQITEDEEQEEDVQAVDKDDEPSDESRTHCMFVQEQITVVYGGAGAHPLGPSPTPKPTRSTSLTESK